MACSCFVFVLRTPAGSPPHRRSNHASRFQNAMLENIACALVEDLVLNLLPGSFSVQR